jgi:hypothetical protein
MSPSVASSCTHCRSLRTCSSSFSSASLRPSRAIHRKQIKSRTSCSDSVCSQRRTKHCAQVAHAAGAVAQQLRQLLVERLEATGREQLVEQQAQVARRRARGGARRQQSLARRSAVACRRSRREARRAQHRFGRRRLGRYRSSKPPAIAKPAARSVCVARRCSRSHTVPPPGCSRAADSGVAESITRTLVGKRVCRNTDWPPHRAA